jgi:hypothetical protein
VGRDCISGAFCDAYRPCREHGCTCMRWRESRSRSNWRTRIQGCGSRSGRAAQRGRWLGQVPRGDQLSSTEHRKGERGCICVYPTTRSSPRVLPAMARSRSSRTGVHGDDCDAPSGAGEPVVEWVHGDGGRVGKELMGEVLLARCAPFA